MAQTLPRFFRNMSIKRVFQQGQPQIMKLPTEILDIILTTCLEAHDSACFILSCKHFYITFRSILQHERLQRRQSYRNTPFVEYKIEREPRARLLRRLETRESKYCVECTSLHDKSAWKKPKGNCRSERRILDKSLCSPHAGQASICPCLGLPLRSRRQVITKIQEHEAAGSHHAGDYWDGTIFHCLGRPNDVLWHICAIWYPSDASSAYVTASVYTELFLKDRYSELTQPDISIEQAHRGVVKKTLISKDRSLNVRNVYAIGTSTEDLPPDVPPLPICPHVDIIPAIRKFFKNPRKSEFSLCAGRKNTRVCEWCSVILSFDRDSAVFDVDVTRDFGRDAEPDEAWSIQCEYRPSTAVLRRMYLYCLIWIAFVSVVGWYTRPWRT